MPWSAARVLASGEASTRPVPLPDFGAGGEGYVRFSLIEPDDRVRRAGAAIAQVLKA